MDEAQYWAWSQDLALGYFSKPPLIAGGAAICGDGEACVRFPSVVLHAITSFRVYGIGARLHSEPVAFFHPEKALEFVLSQFGVFGPILFGALLIIVWRAVRGPHAVLPADRLLLSFALPVLVLVTVQALISRAHANWAAPGYVAAIVLVTAVMLRDVAFQWMRVSFAVHVALAIGIALATWQADRFVLAAVGNPFARTLGNAAVAEAVKRRHRCVS